MGIVAVGDPHRHPIIPFNYYVKAVNAADHRFGKFVQFVGNHGKTTPLIPRPSSLDSSIQCQQICLSGIAIIFV